MTTPTGQISLNDVNVELGKSGTTLISLGASDVRGLAGVASGAISMNNLRGKSSVVNLSYTFSANTANASLNLSALSGYSAGKSNITVTINSGVYLYATSTGSYGLNITGGTTGDTLTIVNNGFIMGKGGNAANSNLGYYTTGESGGPALNLGFAMSSCTINNTNGSAYIGGGGGAGATESYGAFACGGGGAGGGNGGGGPSGQGAGAGGGIGSSGSNGTVQTDYPGGGGGGRIFPGSGGAAQTVPYQKSNKFAGLGGGAGGGGGIYGGANSTSGTTAAGGSGNSAGGVASGNFESGGGGGGGWGASGGNAKNTNRGGPGAGGKAVNTNGKSVTWTSSDTARVYGSVS